MENNAENLFQAVMRGDTLNHEQSLDLFSSLIAGELNEPRIAALLAVMHVRGETAEEISGAAKAFQQAAIKLPTDQPAYDSCGTGGDGANTINISTAAALVAASAGIRMAKHGNRSVSSLTGSADVLERLGIPLGLEPAEAGKQLDEKNFTFLFAPNYHPAIGKVMPVRRGLAMPTMFNILGPLLNPAPLAGQLMGVPNPQLGELVADTLLHLGRPRALVVHGSGLDEIALHGPTKVWEVKDGQVSHYELQVEDLGVESARIEDLRGGDAAENADLIREVFDGGGKQAHRDAIAVNAGAIAYLADRVQSVAQGTHFALDVLKSGEVSSYVDSLAIRREETA